MRSPLGQKYLQITNDLSSSERSLQPLLKQACDAATARLSAADRNSLVSTCGRP